MANAPSSQSRGCSLPGEGHVASSADEAYRVFFESEISGCQSGHFTLNKIIEMSNSERHYIRETMANLSSSSTRAYVVRADFRWHCATEPSIDFKLRPALNTCHTDVITLLGKTFALVVTRSGVSSAGSLLPAAPLTATCVSLHTSSGALRHCQRFHGVSFTQQRSPGASLDAARGLLPSSPGFTLR